MVADAKHNTEQPISPLEQQLRNVLNECARVVEDHYTGELSPPRTHCPDCGESVSIYCPYCLTIMLPTKQWPPVLPKLRLPITIDILHDDRRKQSTGIHVATVLKEAGAAEQFRLFDQRRNEGVPDEYEIPDEGTYLLFPGPTSQPLSSIPPGTIQRLVVLDCTWSKPKIGKHAKLRNLPRIHLDYSSASLLQQSYYWRWHNAGPGMVCTAEAIFCAAWEVATAMGWEEEQVNRLRYLLWLFGIQRDVIRRKYEVNKDGRLNGHMPFTEDGKRFQRELHYRHQVLDQSMKLLEQKKKKEAASAAQIRAVVP